MQASRNIDTLTLSAEVEDVFQDLARVLLRIGSEELSRTAASVLSWLNREGPRRITELAAHQSVAQPTMTALVGRLEKAELVRRRPDPDDARAVLVEVTEAGRAALRERAARRAAHVARRLEQLDDRERTTLAAALPVLRRLTTEDPDQ